MSEYTELGLLIQDTPFDYQYELILLDEAGLRELEKEQYDHDIN